MTFPAPATASVFRSRDTTTRRESGADSGGSSPKRSSMRLSIETTRPGVISSRVRSAAARPETASPGRARGPSIRNVDSFIVGLLNVGWGRHPGGVFTYGTVFIRAEHDKQVGKGGLVNRLATERQPRSLMQATAARGNPRLSR